VSWWVQAERRTLSNGGRSWPVVASPFSFLSTAEWDGSVARQSLTCFRARAQSTAVPAGRSSMVPHVSPRRTGFCEALLTLSLADDITPSNGFLGSILQLVGLTNGDEEMTRNKTLLVLRKEIRPFTSLGDLASSCRMWLVPRMVKILMRRGSNVSGPKDTVSLEAGGVLFRLPTPFRWPWRRRFPFRVGAGTASTAFSLMLDLA
jgi:hypothetical protein